LAPYGSFQKTIIFVGYRMQKDMKKCCVPLLATMLLSPVVLKATGLDLSNKKLGTPPRIIRTCCSFGSDVGVMGVPFFKLTETTSIEDLGDHHYLGSKDEGNGIVYTRKGGFIDVGHLRDQADWTAYFYFLISNHRGEKIELKLPHEGGTKRLQIGVPDSISDDDAILLSGRIAYDLSVWHEIATWFGVSSVPFVPERYSAFSIEDDYSNLLGINLGMDAIRSELPFEQAMTKFLHETLDTMGVVSSEKETLDAMEMVRNQWWSRDYRFPSRKILIERDVTPYTEKKPMLVPQLSKDVDPCEIDLPVVSKEKQLLTSFYILALRLNRKFPVKEMFPGKKGRIITQNDFNVLVDKANFEISQKKEIDYRHQQRRQKTLQ
jgi:hypothetical protein